MQSCVQSVVEFLGKGRVQWAFKTRPQDVCYKPCDPEHWKLKT